MGIISDFDGEAVAPLTQGVIDMELVDGDVSLDPGLSDLDDDTHLVMDPWPRGRRY